MKCFPSLCSCCECQGKHCLVAHPGHSHRTIEWEERAAILEFDAGLSREEAEKRATELLAEGED